MEQLHPPCRQYVGCVIDFRNEAPTSLTGSVRGHPIKRMHTAHARDQVEKLIISNRRLGIRGISVALNVSFETARQIIQNIRPSQVFVNSVKTWRATPRTLACLFLHPFYTLCASSDRPTFEGQVSKSVCMTRSHITFLQL